MNKAKFGLFWFGLVALLNSAAYAADSVIAAKADRSLLIDIAMLSENRLVAVGERGHVLISEDKGKSWRQVITPASAMLTAVTFIDDQTGYAVGHQQVIMKTSDGGETWSLQYQEADDLAYPALMDVWFRDGGWGVAIGAYGLILHTANGGQDWEPVDIENLSDPDFGLPHFYSLDFDGRNNRLYMAGELGFIAVSEDFGQTWQALESPYDGSFFNIAVSRNGSLLAMGLRGHLFRSTDQGATWEEIETETTASINKMVSVKGAQIMFLAVDGIMLFSNDDGKSVTPIQYKERTGLMAGVLADLNDLVVVSEKGIKHIDLDGHQLPQ
ncbi:MAG: hypothetical protein HWE13_11320 [Gammaproteobacteria bacterium]|nr:hypothetical protein [Gammaproteobacteria bacterium]NVK88711.1 hypothetical protein [Gammaproteobacteria bacterium]